MGPGTHAETWATTWRFGLVLFVAAGSAVPSPAQAPRSDPVERLRLVLLAPCRDVTARDRAVQECLDALRTLNDLRRAWSLPEWRDRRPDFPAAASDAANREALTGRFFRAVREELGGGDQKAARAALDLLAEMAEAARARGDPSAPLAPLGRDVAALVRQGPPGLRGPAARTLGQIDPDLPVAIPALGELLQSPDPSLRQAAVEGLAGLLQAAAQSVARPAAEGPARGNHLEAAARAAAVLPVVGRGLNDWHPGVRRRAVAAVQTAATALERMVPDPPADSLDASEVELLQKRVTEERARVRPMVDALAACGPALTVLLREGDVELRLHAQKALEEVAYVRGRWLRQEPGADTPAEAPPDDPFAEGLRAAVPGLVAALSDPDPRVRRSALDTLDQLGPLGAPAVKALALALEDPDRFVRWSAARVLNHLGPAAVREAAPRLRLLLSDPDPDVRRAGSAALDRINP
jgi:HEAT repeat protein